MKDKILTIITVMAIGLILLVCMQSCKKDQPEPGESDVLTNRISQTWKTTRVTADGVDVTGAFKNMSITFREDRTFSVSNAVPPIWPASGSFEVADQHTVKRNDGIAVSVSFPSDASVVLELFYTSQSGRVSGVSGNYRFELTR